jgi:adenosine deaminase
LEAERLGHGTRAKEDPHLLDYLVEKRIPLEMCPLSNVRTGVVNSIDEHPIRHYYRRGLVVTVNTDDPKMFGNSLAEEYRLLEARLGFSREEIRGLVLQGIQASWLSHDRKQQLLQEFCADAAW